MTKNDFLDAITVFTRESVKNIILPCEMQRGDAEQIRRPPNIHKMRLPDSRAHEKEAPYIVHQIITSTDSQKAGQRTNSRLLLRTIFLVYNENEEEGALQLIELTEKFRIDLLKTRVIDSRFEIELDDENLETLIYPDDMPPFYGAEIISAWRMPAVEREDIFKYI